MKTNPKYLFGFQLVIAILCCFSMLAKSQNMVSLQVKTSDPSSRIFIDQRIKQTKYQNVQMAKKALEDAQLLAISKGYLAASFDSMLHDTGAKLFSAHFELNTLFYYHKIWPGNIPVDWWREIGIDSNKLSNKPLRAIILSKWVSEILNYAENHGHPFASLKITNLELDKKGLEGKLHLDRGAFFRFDTIGLLGNARVSKSFIYSYLNIKPSAVYSEKLVKDIDAKLLKLNFVKLSQPTRIYFLNNKVKIDLFLDSYKSDRVDGVVGFAPNSDAKEKKLLITGEANIELKNVLKRGIQFDTRWKSFLKNSQQLHVGTSIPYVLRTSLGLTGSFEFIKTDTQYFTLDSRVGVRYLFQGTDYLEVYYQVLSASLGGVDTNQIRSTQSLPNRNPIRSNNYGLKIVKEKLDYPLNPLRGYRVNINASLGTREIEKDLRVAEVTFLNKEGQEYSLYDSMKLKSTQGQLGFDTEVFIKIGKKSTLVSHVFGKYLLANQYFINDLYRIGGTNSLRGFDESSLLANAYGVASIEYRYLFSKNGYFNVFGNTGFLRDETGNKVADDIPFGFGLGVKLDTKSGLLTLAYAIGSQQGNSIQLNQAKIHFGVVNYF